MQLRCGIALGYRRSVPAARPFFVAWEATPGGALMFDIRRREFIALFGSAAVWPVSVHAQHSERVQRIGLLMSYLESDPEGQAWYAAFREGLQKLGWAEGRNIQIDT